MANSDIWEKDPAEVVDYSIDWSEELASMGPDTIKTGAGNSTWTISPTGEAAIVADSNSTTKANVFISGGVDGKTYILKNTITTEGDRVLTAARILKVLSQPLNIVDGAYTTVDRVAQELGVSDRTTLVLLRSLIQEATDIVKRYCNRDFAYSASIVEKVRGTNRTKILLNRTPLIAIASVTDEASNVLTGATIDDANAGIVYRSSGWPGNAQVLQGLDSGELYDSAGANLTVTYSGGYVLPGATGRTLPFDIERGTIEIIKSLYLSRTRDPNLTSEKADEIYSATYASAVDKGDIPQSAASYLARWRRKAL